ncbi:pyruvate-formate lyase-activating enzyme [Leptolyngbya sp. Heron Island J]|nr:pyruvate-formate lyase-activating enzyme [Leptolyngbya sp. Heron Island J]
MNTVIQTIHCPNCGKPAERHYLNEQQLTRTQCSGCDYLMIVCQRSGKVIEAYAPGIAAAMVN